MLMKCTHATERSSRETDKFKFNPQRDSSEFIRRGSVKNITEGQYLTRST